MRSLALKVQAWVALSAFVASLSLPFLAAQHITFDDDAACGADELSTGHAKTQFDVSQPSAPLGHCALCHWLRAVSGARPGPEVRVTTHLDVVTTRIAPVLQGHSACVQTARASRAPPAPLA